MCNVTGSPGRIAASWVSLKLAVTQMSSGTNMVSAVPVWAYSPTPADSCTTRPGLGLLHLGLALRDLRLLHRQLGIDVLDAGLRRRHLRLRLGERGAVVAVVDAGDHIPGIDVLVVGDRDGDDVARHLRGDRKLA